MSLETRTRNRKLIKVGLGVAAVAFPPLAWLFGIVDQVVSVFEDTDKPKIEIVGEE